MAELIIIGARHGESRRRYPMGESWQGGIRGGLQGGRQPCHTKSEEPHG